MRNQPKAKYRRKLKLDMGMHIVNLSRRGEISVNTGLDLITTSEHFITM